MSGGARDSAPESATFLRIRATTAGKHDALLSSLRCCASAPAAPWEAVMVASSISALAPSEPELTDYDRAHVVTYLRLLDAEAAGASWEEVARLLLGVDPGKARDEARLRYETHADRARWMASQGYLQLLNSPHSGPARRS